jgi:hypothetical protein
MQSLGITALASRVNTARMGGGEKTAHDRKDQFG